MPEMKVHPLAEKLPFMDAQRFAELCASVKDHGLTVPIVRLDGLILDGRNRQKACDKVGKPAHYIEFSELRPKPNCTPEQYIVDQALNRRDLTGDQRIAFAAVARPILAQQAAERMKAGGEAQGTRGKEGGRGKKKPPAAKSTQGVSGTEKREPTTAQNLAEQAGVSEYKARQAEAVARDAPELLPDLIAGKLPLKEAAKKAKEKANPKTEGKAESRQYDEHDIGSQVGRVLDKVKETAERFPQNLRKRFLQDLMGLVEALCRKYAA